MTDPILRLENLCVTYGKKSHKTYAVQDVSLELFPGETMGIVGESGCGKTTVALALMGLLDPRTTVSGNMIISDEKYDLANMDYSQWRKLRGDTLAMVFQDSLASLNPLKKIGEQIAEAIYVKKSMSKQAARKEAINLLEMVEIADAPHRAKQYPHECSGGMRQRAMIAMAIANKPDILICDEPTTALDVTVQAQILMMIKKLQEDLGMGVILVTHDLGVINAVSNTIRVMYASKIVESGTTHDVLRHAQHPYTHALLKAMPDISQKRGSLYSIPGVPPQLTSQFEWCPFAPRCEFWTQQCNERMPVLEAKTELLDHKSACIHPINTTLEVQ